MGNLATVLRPRRREAQDWSYISGAALEGRPPQDQGPQVYYTQPHYGMITQGNPISYYAPPHMLEDAMSQLTPSSFPASPTATPSYAKPNVLLGTFDSDFDLDDPSHSYEDKLAILKHYDIVFVIDDSDSMREHWIQTATALKQLATVAAKYDQNGIDIHFLNSDIFGKNLDANQVLDLFEKVQPQERAPTFIAYRLDALTRPYMGDLERGQKLKPVDYIVITDGKPSDGPEEVICDLATRLMKFPLRQLGIQFLQIGISKNASAYLEKLDNLTQNDKTMRDIVDTVPYRNPGKLGFTTEGLPLSGEFVVKCLLGAIDYREDQKILK